MKTFLSKTFSFFHIKISDEKLTVLSQFIGFGIVGFSNTAISYIVYFVLVRLSVYYILASIIGFVVSVINAFFWNNKFIFSKKDNEERSIIKAFIKTFLSYAGTGLVLSNVLLYVWVDYIGISKVIAPVINLIITVPLNFVLNKLWAFKSKQHIKTAVVTGCTGAIGTALIDELISHNIKVFAVLNPQSKRNCVIPSSPLVKKVFCSIENYDELPTLIDERCDAFFHLAWQGTVGKDRNNTALQEKNVGYALCAVNAAKKLGCTVFTGIGSQAEYGRVNEKLTADTPCNPENEYGKAKLKANIETRKLCEELKIRHEWIRVLSVYGKNDGESSMICAAIRKLQSGISPEYTKGEQIWDFLYSSDAARAIYLVAQNGVDKKTYVLGFGDGKPLSAYINIIHKVVNPKIKPNFGAIEYSDRQVMYLCADITALTADTGFTPEISFEDGINRILENKK